jgi:amino acid adenylation domain-containing protein
VGAVYVPLDPNAPATRTRHLLQDCQIKCLISHTSQARSLAEVVAQPGALKAVIGLDMDWPVSTIAWKSVWEMPANRTFPGRTTAQDLAYIMYTSGSTGLPKGIMHTHYSGLSYARLSADTYQLQSTDRIGNHAPIFFDISTLGYFTAPLVGATTVIVPDAYTKMPASLSQLIEAEQLTVWYSVPLALIQLLQRGVLESRDLTSLRWILYGGEVFPPKYLRSLMQHWPHARFCNVYGPAEVNQCTYYHLEAPPTGDDPIPLGQIWENTKMLLLNGEDQEVTGDAAGELLIRSATMMQGYWNRPDLTEKAFFRHLTPSGLPEVYYRTGDLIRMDELGRLQFMGRKDQQIKTRGYRVELDGVEGLLAAQAGVREAAVFPHQSADGEVVIMAAVILQPSQSITEKELMVILKGELPWYALPQSIFFVENFPRTGSGKTDRPALRQELHQQIELIYG